jgi:hypothetical protein
MPWQSIRNSGGADSGYRPIYPESGPLRGGCHLSSSNALMEKRLLDLHICRPRFFDQRFGLVLSRREGILNQEVQAPPITVEATAK